MSKYNLLTRLKRGAGGQLLLQMVMTLTPLVGIPIMLHAWGTQLYGEWLILTAIPTYLSMSDMGFSRAAVREMAMCMGRQDMAGAVCAFQSSLAMTSVISFVVVGAGILLAYTVPIVEIFHFRIMDMAMVRAILIIQLSAVILSILEEAISGGMMCDGKYGEAFTSLAAVKLFNSCSIWLAALLGASPVMVSAVSAVTNVLGLLGLAWVLRRLYPWLHFGYSQARFQVFRNLLVPSLANMSLPLSQSINLQGFRMVVGYVLGPQAVVVFATARTLTRLVYQMLMTVNRVISPEVGNAYGSGDMDLLRRLHRRACQTSLWVALGASLFVGVFGESIYRVWTNGSVTLDRPTFYLLLLVTIINALWYTSFTVQQATNTHARISGYYLAANTVSIVAGFATTYLLGLPGAALALCLVEIYMLLRVIPSALEFSEDRLPVFLRYLATPPVFLLRPEYLGLRRRTAER